MQVYMPRMVRAAATTSSEREVAQAPVKNLGKSDFMTLLIAQLKNMDIGGEGTNQEFIAQMAQFTMVEELQNLSTTFQELMGRQLITEAGAMVGKHVEALPPGYEQPISGEVKSVEIIGGLPYLIVNGTRINVAHVIRIT